MKKIEEGCMAIVVKGEGLPHLETNVGKIITVGKFIGKKRRFAGNLWKVDQLMTYVSGEKFRFAPEHTMERIDDDTTDKEHETEFTMEDKNYE